MLVKITTTYWRMSNFVCTNCTSWWQTKRNTYLTSDLLLPSFPLENLTGQKVLKALYFIRRLEASSKLRAVSCWEHCASLVQGPLVTRAFVICSSHIRGLSVLRWAPVFWLLAMAEAGAHAQCSTRAVVLARPNFVLQSRIIYDKSNF
jgi:hypothetical protein